MNTAGAKGTRGLLYTGLLGTPRGAAKKSSSPPVGQNPPPPTAASTPPASPFLRNLHDRGTFTNKVYSSVPSANRPATTLRTDGDARRVVALHAGAREESPGYVGVRPDLLVHHGPVHDPGRQLVLGDARNGARATPHALAQVDDHRPPPQVAGFAQGSLEISLHTQEHVLLRALGGSAAGGAAGAASAGRAVLSSTSRASRVAAPAPTVFRNRRRPDRILSSAWQGRALHLPRVTSPNNPSLPPRRLRNSGGRPESVRSSIQRSCTVLRKTGLRSCPVIRLGEESLGRRPDGPAKGDLAVLRAAGQRPQANPGRCRTSARFLYLAPLCRGCLSWAVPSGLSLPLPATAPSSRPPNAGGLLPPPRHPVGAGNGPASPGTPAPARARAARR